MTKQETRWVRGKYFYDAPKKLWKQIVKAVEKLGYIEAYKLYKQGKLNGKFN